MTPERPDAPPARAQWPLRVTLGLVLTVLVVAGDRVYQSNQSANSSVTTTLARSSTTLPHTTTTTGALSSLDRPTINPGTLDQRTRGCAMHLTSTSTTTTSGAPTTTLRPLSGIGHCTVLEIGDSLGNDLGWGLARELVPRKGLRFIQLDKSSTGLSAGWFYNWHHHLAADLRRYRPNLVLICLGANDEQAIAVNGVSQAFGSAAWATAYRARVRELVTLATRSGSFVLWVGLPIMEPAQYNRGVNFLNAQYRAVVTSVPGGAFQPTRNLMASPQGLFRAGARVNGLEAALRQPDGIHFTVIGEDVFSTFIAHQIAAIYHIGLPLRAPMTIDG